MILAADTSHTSDSAIKSPYEDILSAPLALAYAQAMGESSSMSSMKYIFFIVSSSGFPIAAPAGETCLKDVAAG